MSLPPRSTTPHGQRCLVATTSRTAILLAAVAACQPQPTEEYTPPPCSNFISWSRPANGALDAYYRTPIVVFVDPKLVVRAVSVDGPEGDVPGTLTISGGTYTFLPSSPLKPNKGYTVRVHRACGDDTVYWQTGDVGAPTSPTVIGGAAYAFDLENGQAFGAVAALALAYFASSNHTQLLLGVSDASDDAVAFLEGVSTAGAEPAQDVCYATVTPAHPSDFSQNPYFEVGPMPALFLADGVPLHVPDLVIHGAFAADGERIVALLNGTLDLREVEVFWDSLDAHEACASMAEIDEPCVECGEASPGAYCVPLTMLTEARPHDAPLVPIPDQETACANPECEDAPQCAE